VFHDVHDEGWFRELVGAIVSNYNVITPHDFERGHFTANRVNVLITFDDGYASWKTKVLPILATYDIKGLFFINSGLLDVAENSEKSDTFMRKQLLIHPRVPLSWDGARALAREGHTVGVHGRNHLNLATLDLEAIRTELVTDKERIESMLSTQVTACAYPFGTPKHINEMVKRVAKACGFTRGYTAVSRFVGMSETFATPRMCIESDVSPTMLRYWIDGAYDIFNILKSVCVR
jgi:peptidoglycan/xylan/chitin deacetylase (PgdA/CDA1 family)